MSNPVRTLNEFPLAVGNEMQNEVEGIRSKRIKLEPVDADVEENRNDSGDKARFIFFYFFLL